jgi:hypothetical protein
MFCQVHAGVAGTASPQRHHRRGQHMLQRVFRMMVSAVFILISYDFLYVCTVACTCVSGCCL